MCARNLFNYLNLKKDKSVKNIVKYNNYYRSLFFYSLLGFKILRCLLYFKEH